MYSGQRSGGQLYTPDQYCVPQHQEVKIQRAVTATMHAVLDQRPFAAKLKMRYKADTHLNILPLLWYLNKGC